MQHVILQNYPDADISVSMIWINMLPADNRNAMERAAQTINDLRVQHFYDPKKRAGTIIAQSLGEPSQVAWDIYLFYPAGNEWKNAPPQPIAWTHQLSDMWVDHYRYGDDLSRELHKITEYLIRTAERRPRWNTGTRSMKVRGKTQR